jgi:hypothetical protein
MYFINTVHAGVISSAPSISSAGINILNFLLSVAGIIAIISLVIAGSMYLIISGDEKKMQVAKRAMQTSILGIILAMGGMIFVRVIGQFFSGN